MQMKVVLTPDGKALVSVQQGTFETARVQIEKVLRDLGLDGIKIELETPIEQHKHSQEEEAVHRQAHQRN